MDDKWLKYLQMLGLTESEVSVYLATLKLGSQPVQNIAKEMRFSRVTVYAAIESLTKHGLMTSVEKGKKQLYAAEPPERIVWLAENKMHDLKNSIDEIKSSISELKLIQSGDKPIVKLFEGSDAMGAMEEDVLPKKIDIMYEFGNRDRAEEIYPIDRDTRKKYFEELAKKKIDRRLMFLAKEKDPRSVEVNKHMKFLNEAESNFDGDVFVYADTVWLTSLKNKQISVYIQNKEIADTLKALLEIAWKNIK